jgi:hypothetical protein
MVQIGLRGVDVCVKCDTSSFVLTYVADNFPEMDI